MLTWLHASVNVKIGVTIKAGLPSFRFHLELLYAVSLIKSNVQVQTYSQVAVRPQPSVAVACSGL
jgi:hypothetical protein